MTQAKQQQWQRFQEECQALLEYRKHRYQGLAHEKWLQRWFKVDLAPGSADRANAWKTIEAKVQRYENAFWLKRLWLRFTTPITKQRELYYYLVAEPKLIKAMQDPDSLTSADNAFLTGRGPQSLSAMVKKVSFFSRLRQHFNRLRAFLEENGLPHPVAEPIAPLPDAAPAVAKAAQLTEPAFDVAAHHARILATDSAKDPWTILRLEPNSSLQEVKIAYRKLAKIYHPDHYQQTHPELYSTATNDTPFTKLKDAYESLTTLPLQPSKSIPDFTEEEIIELDKKQWEEQLEELTKKYDKKSKEVFEEALERQNLAQQRLFAEVLERQNLAQQRLREEFLVDGPKMLEERIQHILEEKMPGFIDAWQKLQGQKLGANGPSFWQPAQTLATQTQTQAESVTHLNPVNPYQHSSCNYVF